MNHNANGEVRDDQLVHEAEEEEQDPIPALDRYAHAVDEIVERELTDDAVNDRLARFKKAVETSSNLHHDLDYLIEELSRYAIQVVRSWVAIIALGDPDNEPRADDQRGLYTNDADELAESVVARAVVGFRDEVTNVRWWMRQSRPETKRQFLLECALQLPSVYRSGLLHRGDIPWDAREEEARWSFGDADEQAELFRRLADNTIRRRRGVELVLGGFGYSEAEVAEILQATEDTFAQAHEELNAREGKRT